MLMHQALKEELLKVEPHIHLALDEVPLMEVPLMVEQPMEEATIEEEVMVEVWRHPHRWWSCNP